MRFIHLSDLHLGKSVCGISMFANQWCMLNEVLRMCDFKPFDVDAVLVSAMCMTWRSPQRWL